MVVVVEEADDDDDDKDVVEGMSLKLFVRRTSHQFTLLFTLQSTALPDSR